MTLGAHHTALPKSLTNPALLRRNRPLARSAASGSETDQSTSRAAAYPGASAARASRGRTARSRIGRSPALRGSHRRSAPRAPPSPGRRRSPPRTVGRPHPRRHPMRTARPPDQWSPPQPQRDPMAMDAARFNGQPERPREHVEIGAEMSEARRPRGADTDTRVIPLGEVPGVPAGHLTAEHGAIARRCRPQAVSRPRGPGRGEPDRSRGR